MSPIAHSLGLSRSTYTVFLTINTINNDVSVSILAPIAGSYCNDIGETAAGFAIRALQTYLSQIPFDWINKRVLPFYTGLANIEFEGLLEDFSNDTIAEEDVDLESNRTPAV